MGICLMTNNENSEFPEQWFQECPVAILTLDSRGHIHQVNRALQELIGVDPEELTGHNAETLPYPDLRGLFDSAGQFQLTDSDKGARWYQCLARDIPASGTVMHCFQDVTEIVHLQEKNGQLRQQLDDLAITDALTGIANRRSLNRALNAQVTRSRRYHNPLSLAVVEVGLGDAKQAPSDEVILAVSRFLRDRLRWVDVIARVNENQFALVLPETTIDDGRRLLNKIQQGFADSELFEGVARQTVRLYIGLAEWQKGNDARLLMKRATEALALEIEADTSS